MATTPKTPPTPQQLALAQQAATAAINQAKAALQQFATNSKADAVTASTAIATITAQILPTLTAELTLAAAGDPNAGADAAFLEADLVMATGDQELQFIDAEEAQAQAITMAIIQTAANVAVQVLLTAAISAI